MSDGDNIGSPVNVSVLDDLCRWIISYNRDNLDTGRDRAKILQIIRKESAKLTV